MSIRWMKGGVIIITTPLSLRLVDELVDAVGPCGLVEFFLSMRRLISPKIPEVVVQLRERLGVWRGERVSPVIAPHW